MRMPTNRAGHHRRVGDAESVDTADPQLRIHHAGLVAAHAAGAHRVVQGVRTSGQRQLESGLVQLGAVARSRDGPKEISERAGLRDPRAYPQARHHGGPVYATEIGQVTRFDDRLGMRIGGPQRDLATALRRDQNRAEYHTVTSRWNQRFVVKRRRGKNQLQIGQLQFGSAADKSVRLADVGGEHAAASQ